MHIVNTAGWDTDCNAGNIGCLFGIKNGLAGLDAGPDWRTPVADRMYISSADGGASITDAVIETRALVVAGYRLAGAVAPEASKGGARFHFSFPGSLQGFACEGGAPATQHPLSVENVAGHSRRGERSLALGFRRLAPGRVARVATPTFFGKDGLTMPTYQMVACPTLYPGQTVECGLAADVLGGAVRVRLYASVFTAGDTLVKIHGEPRVVSTQSDVTLKWRLPDTGGYPIFDIGLEIEAHDPRGIDGTLYLDWLHWEGAPTVTFRRPDLSSEMWKHAWVNDVSQFQTRWEGLRITSSAGQGFIAQGTRDWRDYEVAATVTPLLAEAWGLAARVQGRERYYALVFDRAEGGRVRLVRRRHRETVLAALAYPWSLDQSYALALVVDGDTIRASIDGKLMFEVQDSGSDALSAGAVALLVDTGSISTQKVRVTAMSRVPISFPP